MRDDNNVENHRQNTNDHGRERGRSSSKSNLFDHNGKPK